MRFFLVYQREMKEEASIGTSTSISLFSYHSQGVRIVLVLYFNR
ncbi:hypothetical protein ACFFGV_17415 [Pontibacillus salicampi]|uniref:Uncharacterized protein n=1 Tax=Pontibacillus salicampi TaxID=1449801 RepID=A0ABV6LSK7_9BACI